MPPGCPFLGPVGGMYQLTRFNAATGLNKRPGYALVGKTGVSNSKGGPRTSDPIRAGVLIPPVYPSRVH